MKEIITIQNIPCYEENGVAYLNLETCARGLGFTQEKNGTEYVRWDRVKEYLEELNFSPQVGKDGFIPENVFYRLSMKAKNETAEAFQAKIADEVIPAIRKTGTYSAKLMSPAELSLLQAQALVDIEKKQKEQQGQIDTVNTRLDNIGDILSLNANGWRRESKEMIVRIAQALGGNSFIRDVTAEIYQIMLDRFGISVKQRMINMRHRALEAGLPKSRTEKISGVDAIAEDKKAIEAYLTIIKEMAIKYGLDKHPVEA